MMDQLQVDDQLQVLHEADQEYYMTRIKEVSQDTFAVCEPESGGKTLKMPQFSSWQFCLLRDDAVYFFTSRIVAINRESSESYYLIRKPDSVHRQQRRGHVRVPCHHNIVYWPWEDALAAGLPSPMVATRTSELWEDPVWMRDYLKSLEETVTGRNAFTLDMSGGGLRMVSLEQLERHDRILLKLALDQKSPAQAMLLEAKVVRVVPLNIGGWQRYRVGISFVGLPEKVQEKIISYLFTVMRKKI
jgi:c-di-GMP-binding flagellar brake protein YcgR